MDALSLTGHRWHVSDEASDPAIATQVSQLARQLALPPVAAGCLWRRTREIPAARWLSPDIGDLHDPMRMLGMDRAVERIHRAARGGQHVRIVTDYDVDGTTSSLILQNTLRLLGAGRIDYHIPDRFDEGYGFSVRAAEAAVRDGVDLLVTADIGVRDHEAVRRAAEGGVDVIVCDHHLPAGATVPDAATAVLCPPQEGCDYPNPALAACGVSLKLAQALLAHLPRYDAIVRSMLKVAAIGTVADVVDLGTSENRAIVALGIEELRRGPHAPGLQALLEVSGLSGGHVESTDLGFRLGPRINAAGRIDSATSVIELFAERDPQRALARARELDHLNQQRQQLQERLERLCLQQVEGTDSAFPVLWGLESEGWHRGVLGIVAARIRDRVHRPVALASVHGEAAHGSVRSVGVVHAVQALDVAADLLERYGGHPAAAGFSLPADRLEALARRLDEWVRANVSDDALVPVMDIEGSCVPAEVDRSLAVALERLGPFGKGNPTPRLCVREVRPRNVRPMGTRHLRFDASGVDAVWWGGAPWTDKLPDKLDLAATVGFNRWRGSETLRLTVKDARPAA